MMEGVSGGAVKGKRLELHKQYRDEDRAAEDNRWNMAFGARQEQRGKDNAFREEQQKLNEANARLNRGVAALNVAMKVAASSPTPEQTVVDIQKHLNPEGAPVDVRFSAGEADPMTISFAGDGENPGWEIKGTPAQITQMLQVMEANPDKSTDVLKKAAELGVISIKEITPEAGKGKGGAGGSGNKKVSDYVGGIKAIGAKYKLAPQGITVNAQGKEEINLEALLGGADTAYRAIQKVVAEEQDPAKKAEAAQDLQRIQWWYEQIAETLGKPPGPGEGNTTGTPPAVDATVEIAPGYSVSEANLEHTMAQYKMTRDEVIAELRKRNQSR